MEKRILGWTGLELTEVGLGTWALGGGEWVFGWGDQDDSLSIATIHRALELGVNWIDTAPIYGLGHSEEVIGKALKNFNPRPLIATKFSRRWDEQRRPIGNLKPDSIRREVEESLRRLNVEVIDLYQMHWPKPEEEIEIAWETVATLVKAGKIRFPGVCNLNVDQLKRLQPIYPVASLQPPYSMLRRDIENDLLSYCAENRIGVVAYSPMQKGILTDKFSREFVDNLPGNDHRSGDPYFKEPMLSKFIELNTQLGKIAQANQHSIAELAIAWVLRRPEVTSAIVGARKPGQIEQTVNAAGWKLSKTEIDTIEELLTNLKS
jgi:aryl-alcohol dehydrogenase-like predicted oxidoreductase